MTTLLLTLTLALVFYLNFRWGFSQPYQVAGLEHEVRERDYFFIASFALWGVWVGVGLAAVMEWIEEELRARQPAVGGRWALAPPVRLPALVPPAGNGVTGSRAV